VQSFVQAQTGSTELGWAAAAASGLASGVLLLGHLPASGAAAGGSRPISAVVGAATGVFGPILAAMFLAQVTPSPG
jgi:hypothetical protein